MINNHNILDVLNFMFDYIFEATNSEEEIDDTMLENHLANAGFDEKGIHMALKWLDNISALQDGKITPFAINNESLRVYSEQEKQKINLKNRNFLFFLENIGLLDPMQRELIISQVTSLNTKDISLNDFKWVVIMVLGNNSNNNYSNAWLEAVILDEHHQTIQ